MEGLKVKIKIFEKKTQFFGPANSYNMHVVTVQKFENL